VFAVHRGEILKTKFMEPREWALMRRQTRWVFRASMRSSAEAEPSAPTLRFAWEVFRPSPAQFWLNLQNDYDLRLAEGSGIGRKIKPRKAAYSGELTGTR
jgi:antitoxin HigA-1